MRSKFLVENLTFDQAQVKTQVSNEGKDLYLEGLFIEGERRNHNERIYPRHEIQRAVEQINEQIHRRMPDYEVDHDAKIRFHSSNVTGWTRLPIHFTPH